MHWFLVFLTILPKVLIFWTSTHSWTWRVRTLLTNCAINQIDAIEWRKINKTGIIINVMEIFLTDWRNRQHERLTNRWNLLLGVIAQPFRNTWTFLTFQLGELCWVFWKLTVRKLIPELSDAWACLCKEYFNVPGWNFFLGLNVFPLSKKELKLAAKFILGSGYFFKFQKKNNSQFDLFLIFVSWRPIKTPLLKGCERFKNSLCECAILSKFFSIKSEVSVKVFKLSQFCENSISKTENKNATFKSCKKIEFLFVFSDEVILKLTQIVTRCTR